VDQQLDEVGQVIAALYLVNTVKLPLDNVAERLVQEYAVGRRAAECFSPGRASTVEKPVQVWCKFRSA
jgi:hypothetical protein